MTLAPKILVVEDNPKLRNMFSDALKQSLNAEVAAVAYLEDARTVLREAHSTGQPFDAIITDCGFPARAGEDNIRDAQGHIPYNGIKLVGEIRKGHYGKYHSIVPIAFNSAESHRGKGEMAQTYGGLTESFKKGTNYPEFRKIKPQEYTVANVTAETVSWLSEHLSEQEIAGRKAFAQERDNGITEQRTPRGKSVLSRLAHRKVPQNSGGRAV